MGSTVYENFSSPSLKPVKVRNLIENFEKNAKLNTNDTRTGHQKGRLIDAFGVLMSSGGDTPSKTPRKKLKRLSVKATGKQGSLEKWIRK